MIAIKGIKRKKFGSNLDDKSQSLHPSSFYILRSYSYLLTLTKIVFELRLYSSWNIFIAFKLYLTSYTLKSTCSTSLIVSKLCPATRLYAFQTNLPFVTKEIIIDWIHYFRFLKKLPLQQTKITESFLGNFVK